MRNHEQLFAEVREAFIDMDVTEEVDIKRVDLALHELDEIEAIEKAKVDREENGTIPHEMVNWE